MIAATQDSSAEFSSKIKLVVQILLIDFLFPTSQQSFTSIPMALHHFLFPPVFVNHSVLL